MNITVKSDIIYENIVSEGYINNDRHVLNQAFGGIKKFPFSSYLKQAGHTLSKLHVAFEAHVAEAARLGQLWVDTVPTPTRSFLGNLGESPESEETISLCRDWKGQKIHF